MVAEKDYLEVVCGVLTDGAGRILVCLRPEGKSLAGLWEFPGGKVEVGESGEVALKRELLEELGCVVEVGEALSAVEHDYGDFRIRLRPFRCLLESGEVRALEHADVRWLERSELGSVDFAGADLPILREI